MKRRMARKLSGSTESGGHPDPESDGSLAPAGGGSARRDHRAKTDDWLVHMVGLLAVAVGTALVMGVVRRETGTAVLGTLAVGAALAFAGIDFWYGVRGVIRPVYFADGIIELGWVGLLGLTRRV
jgi:hypothetical protein